ncbi:bifunctional serine/threonine-protein kinase/ABC transporter substrate-binding protein [Streptomyces chartreusis]
MGVVYLGRDDDGTLAAVKVIRGESADDPDFRARFAREAELARRVTSPWVVPVLGADAEAAEPWLATAFVPGPSLVEAVAEHGPLPVATARSLGRLLADVLADLHAAGLVHRDVKPANILLAADGPRLIDFGIARAVGVTALTADGSVIGSPGYLSPEQARGRTVGPASDVFSLGCVLAHAATGRPVFGVGGAAGVLYRTVHEEPDLNSVPDALDGIVRRCLAKDPEQRPSVGELRERFGEFDEQGWLPEGLPALVAARAARVLELPVPQGTVADGAPVDGWADAVTQAAVVSAAEPTSRRRVLAAGGAVLGVSAVGVGSWWRWGRSTSSGATGTGPLPRRVIGLLGDRSDGAFTAHERGARVAVSEHNATAGRAFDLVLRTADDGGTAKGAAAAAARLAADPEVSLVIGTGTNATAPAAVEACARARVAQLITRADTSELDGVNLTSTLLMRSTRTAGPPAILRYLNGVVKPARTTVVHDLTDGAESLQTVRIITVHKKLDSDAAVEEVAPDRGFTTAARRIAARRADAVLFAGVHPDRAASFARELREAGYRGPCVADEHVLGARFLAEADGWHIGTGYTDAVADPRVKAFTAAHRARFGAAPAPWAAEAYDTVRFGAHGLAATGDDDRSVLRSELLRRSWQGITRKVSYDPDSEFFEAQEDAGAFLYRVKDRTMRFVARADDISRTLK